MSPDYSVIGIDREFSAFNSTAEPTSFTIQVRNDNPYQPDNSNTVSISYSPIVDGEYRTEDSVTLTPKGGEARRGTITWPTSVYDGSFSVGVGIQTMSVYDGSSYDTVTDLDTYQQLSTPLRVYPPSSTISLDGCGVSQGTISPGDSILQDVSIQNNTTDTPTAVVRSVVGDSDIEHTAALPTDASSTSQHTISIPTSSGDTPTGVSLDVSAQLVWLEYQSFAE